MYEKVEEVFAAVDQGTPEAVLRNALIPGRGALHRR